MGKNVDALKSSLNLSSNTFSICQGNLDIKSATKIVNPFGKSLQMTTSDIATIKEMMKFAAENNQEITVLIPLRKTKNVTA